VFFSEEKNQKTFNFWSFTQRFDIAGAAAKRDLGCGCHVGHHNRIVKKKAFLTVACAACA
jgi:hypothetical protein